MRLRWCGSWVAPRDVTSTRSRTTGILGGSTPDADGARSGPQRALGRRPRSPESLDADLIALVDRLTRRLRAAHRVCRTVVLRLRFDDFTRATRSHTFPEATADTVTLLAAERALLVAALPMIRDQGITLIGISFTNLQNDGAIQLALPFDGWEDRRSTPRSTRCVTSSARRPSRGASSSGGARACRFRSSPTRSASAAPTDDRRHPNGGARRPADRETPHRVPGRARRGLHRSRSPPSFVGIERQAHPLRLSA